MAKRKKQNKKLSIASILGLVLLGLVAIGVVANVIKDNVKEEDPIVEELPGENEEPGDNTGDTGEEQPGGDEVTLAKFYYNGEEFTFEEGMTWAEWLESEYNVDGRFYLGSNFDNIYDDYDPIGPLMDGEYSYFVTPDLKVQAISYTLGC